MVSDAPAPLATLGRSKAFWKWIGAVVLAGITTAVPFTWAWVIERPSRADVDKAIAGNNHVSELDKNRLHTLERRVAAMRTQNTADRQRIDTLDQQLYQEIWLRVGLQAADASPARKRALAAREARKRFEDLTKNHDYETAARMALETPPPR